jgi:mannosyltransferase
MDLKLVKKPALRTPRPLKHRTILSVIAGVMGINVLISIFSLLHQSLRLDESQSIWQVSHSYAGMLRVVAEDVHVPLYHSLLHFWIMAFGDSVASVRSLSLLFFLALIPMVYKLSRLILSDRQSLLASILVGLSPFMIWYGNEARMYSLLALMTVISQYFFIRILQKRDGANWTGYVLTAMIGAYSHYFFLAVLATQGIYYLIARKSFAPVTFKKLIGTAIAVIAVLSPWLLFVHSMGSAAGERPMLVRPTTIDFFNTFSQFIFGFQPNSINSIIVSFWPLVILLAFLAIGKNKRFPKEIQFMGLAVLVPIVGAYALSYLVTPIFVSRYLIIGLPALYIFLAWLITSYAKKVGLVITAIMVVAVGLTSIHQNASASTPVKENYQPVAAEISAKVTSSDAVVLSTPFTEYPFDYYYSGTAQVTTLPNWVKGPMPAFDPAKLPEQVNTLAASHEYVYLVLSYDQGYEKTIHSYFENHYQLVSTKTYSNDLTLYVYHLGYRTVPTY